MFEKDCPVPESLHSMLGNILFLSLLFFMTFLGRFIFSPLMPSIETELDITHSQAGALFLMISLGFFIGQVFSGFLSSRVNHRGSLVISTLGIGIALLCFNLTSALWTLRAIMFLLGMSAGLHLPSAMATITAMVNRQEWGKALAIHQTAPPLSLVLGPLLVIILLESLSWRAILTITGAAALVTGLLFLRFGRCGEFPGDPPSPALIKKLITHRSFWVLMILFALAMGGTIGIYTMLPLFLVNERGFDAQWANTLVGLSRITGLFMPSVSGWLISRFQEKPFIFAVMVFSGITTIMLGVFSDKGLLFIIFLQPAVIGCYFTAGFAALARIVQPDLRSIATSFTTPAAFLIGGGIVPAVMGYMGQAYSFGLGITLTGVLMIVFCPLVFLLKLLENLDEGC
jgi:MFS transporter, NNP family, nitrate/nitrite transporter